MEASFDHCHMECGDLLNNVACGYDSNVVYKKRRMSVCQMKQMKSQNKGVLNDFTKFTYKQKHNLSIPQLWQSFARRSLMLKDSFKNFKVAELPTERVVRYQYNSITKSWAKDECDLKIEGVSFNQGAMRECFRVKKMPNYHKSTETVNDWKYAGNYVAKRYMETVDRHVYFEDVRLQMDAKLWAEEFNHTLGVKRKVDIVKMCVIEFKDRPNEPLYHLEHFIEGDYIKYNSNSGFVEHTRNTPQAFSHFTFERSGHELIVVDIQGVGDLYTDPQIHTMCQTGYGDGNLGCRGMALFFHSHACNHVCASLGLAEFDLAPSEIAALGKLNGNATNKPRGKVPVKSLRVSNISSSRESALINILDEKIEEDPVSPDHMVFEEPTDIFNNHFNNNTSTHNNNNEKVLNEDNDNSVNVSGGPGVLVTQMSSPDSGIGGLQQLNHSIDEDDDYEENNGVENYLSNDRKRNSSSPLAKNGVGSQSRRRRFRFDSGADSDNSNKHESDSIGSYTSHIQHVHRPSCAAFVLMTGLDRGDSILGKVHHEISTLHESGRFINKEDPSQKFDWEAIVFHENMAANLNYQDSVVTMAHYFLDLPDKHFLNNCPIPPDSKDVFQGWLFLRKAAMNNHLPSIMALADSSDINAGGESFKNLIGKDNEPDWMTVVHWLKTALECLSESDSIDVTSYQIKARLGNMYRLGGHSLEKDLETAMDYYNEAAEEATEAMKGRLANKFYEIVEEISAEMDEEPGAEE